jgi:hypothetical protein
VDDATALDTAVDALKAYATAGDPPIRSFLGARERPSSRFSGRHHGCHLLADEGQAAEILEQLAPAGKGDGVPSAIRLSWVLPARGHSERGG